MIGKGKGKILKCQPRIIEFPLPGLAQAKIEPCFDSLLGIRKSRYKLAELFQGKVIQLVIIEIDGKLEIGVLLRVLTGSDRKPNKGKEQWKEVSGLHIEKR